MLCKPIKVGITIYCAIFPESGYLYDWVWFTGSGTNMAPQGQPTDDGDMDEDNPLHTGFIMTLVLSLLAGKFIASMACVYLDKASTSNKLARALDEQGVAMVPPPIPPIHLPPLMEIRRHSNVHI